MKGLFRFLVVIILSILVGNKLISMSDSETPVYPTVFLVMRNYTQEIDWYQILRSALHDWDGAVKGSPVFHIPYKHVCIVDEGDTWAVLFFTLGNGRTVVGPNFYDFSEEDNVFKGSPNRVVYLSKETLEEIPKPESGITHLPTLGVDILPEDSLFFQEKEQYETSSNKD